MDLGVAGVVDENEEGRPHSLVYERGRPISVEDPGDAGGYRRDGAGDGNTHTMSFTNIRCFDDELACYDDSGGPLGGMPSGDEIGGVTNGVSKVVVVSAGSGCDDGEYGVVFAPALGSEATAVVSGNTVSEVRLDWPGSGHTSVPSATVVVEGCDGIELRAVINGLAPLTIGRQGTGYTSAPTVIIGDGGASEPAEVDATLSGEKVSLAFRQTTVSTETTCSTTRATGGGYTSAPGIVLSGGVQDYLMLYEGLTADAPSLKPRTGTLSAARQHDLRYFDAVLPAAGAMRLVHSGSVSVHFQVHAHAHAVYTQYTCSVYPTRSSSCRLYTYYGFTRCLTRSSSCHHPRCARCAPAPPRARRSMSNGVVSSASACPTPLAPAPRQSARRRWQPSLSRQCARRWRATHWSRARTPRCTALRRVRRTGGPILICTITGCTGRTTTSSSSSGHTSSAPSPPPSLSPSTPPPLRPTRPPLFTVTFGPQPHPHPHQVRACQGHPPDGPALLAPGGCEQAAAREKAGGR